MDKETIIKNLGYVLDKTDFKNLGARRQGKVRDIYEQPDKLILISTDRYSAFDRNLALIPFKGQILTQTSKWWFDQTRDIIKNHILESPDPNVVVAKKCKVVPIEMVVRGYITGVTGTSLWTLYQGGQRDFGSFTLPEGMTKNQKLPEPVLTPTTKSDEHDRPMSPKQIIEEGVVEKNLWDKIERTSLELFSFGQKLALERGLILVDTKYEFGVDDASELTLIDEIHTPDSSRYWQAATYQKRIADGLEPENFDKEFLRLWFREHSDPYKDKIMPKAPPDLVAELSHRYIRIFEQITGEKFAADFSETTEARLQRNLDRFFI